MKTLLFCLLLFFINNVEAQHLTTGDLLYLKSHNLGNVGRRLKAKGIFWNRTIHGNDITTLHYGSNSNGIYVEVTPGNEIPTNVQYILTSKNLFFDLIAQFKRIGFEKDDREPKYGDGTRVLATLDNGSLHINFVTVIDNIGNQIFNIEIQEEEYAKGSKS